MPTIGLQRKSFLRSFNQLHRSTFLLLCNQPLHFFQFMLIQNMAKAIAIIGLLAYAGVMRLIATTIKKQNLANGMDQL